jgi:hypothetical protein
MEEITAEERTTPQTIDRYQANLRDAILPPRATSASARPPSAASTAHYEASPQITHQSDNESLSGSRDRIFGLRSAT